MKTLADVRARDLMQEHVTTLNVDAPIREAVETLRGDGVSGAPVLDAAGKVVGMLSVSDIARPEHLEGDRINEVRGDYDLGNPIGDAFEEERVEDEEFTRSDYSPEMLGRETVGDWMRPTVISVAPDAPLRRVCELMLSERVHRIVVIENGTLHGIISTMDIVRHLATTI
jgi:predicted transcriptional regulator